MKNKEEVMIIKGKKSKINLIIPVLVCVIASIMAIIILCTELLNLLFGLNILKINTGDIRGNLFFVGIILLTIYILIEYFRNNIFVLKNGVRVNYYWKKIYIKFSDIKEIIVYRVRFNSILIKLKNNKSYLINFLNADNAYEIQEIVKSKIEEQK